MPHPPGDGHFIGIDWGTTHARALLFAAGAIPALPAAPALEERYRHALAFFHFHATAFDVQRVTADGFVALERARRSA